MNKQDTHQIFTIKNEEDILLSSVTLDKIARKDSNVWIMNHFFINPQLNSKDLLEKQMQKVWQLAQETNLPIWPLDPMIIDYFTRILNFTKFGIIVHLLDKIIRRLILNKIKLI